MAAYKAGARSQGLSSTAALVAKGIPPAQGEAHMMIARANPNPPQHQPGRFSRDASPDTPEVGPGTVIKEG